VTVPIAGTDYGKDTKGADIYREYSM